MSDKIKNFNNKWSDEQIDLAREMWGAGYSGKEIGDKINKTRNAVIGKLNRMGYAQLTDKTNTVARLRKKFAAHILQPPKERLEIMKTSCGEKKLLIDLQPNECHYPLGKPSDKAVYFCGGDIHKGLYCKEHYDLTHIKGTDNAKNN